MLGELLTVGEAARKVGRDPETIRRWIWKGKLHSLKVGGQHFIAPSALEDAVEEERGLGISGARVSEARAAYVTTAEELKPLPPEEIEALLAQQRKPGGPDWSWVEATDAVRERIKRRVGYLDVVGAVRESRESHPGG